MNFKEDSFMVAIALCVVFFVVAQALFFLVRAVKRAKELGICLLYTSPSPRDA